MPPYSRDLGLIDVDGQIIDFKCFSNMFPFKVTATIDGVRYPVDVKQVDPLHAHYEVMKDGIQLGKLNKTNDKWFADEDSCLLPEDVSAIGQAIDDKLQSLDL
jgi:hypothetical protein